MKDGDFSSSSDGTEDSLLIQNDNATFSSRVLLFFDLSALPSIPSTDLFDAPKSATLVLEHIVGISQSLSTNVTVVLLQQPSTNATLIEKLSWDTFQSSKGIDGPTFVVEPSDVEVSVDVTDLVFGAAVQKR